MANKTMHHAVIGSDTFELQDQALRGTVADEYSASSAYAVGDIVLYSGQMYECNTAISTAEAWTAAHWTSITAGDEISQLKGDLTSVATGDYTEKLEVGGFWKTTGEKSVSDTAKCTPPIHVPAGWTLVVSTGIGTSGNGITEVTANNQYVGNVVVGSCKNYALTPTVDKYYSISSNPSTDEYITRKILLTQQKIEVEKDVTRSFVDFPIRGAIIRSTGVIDASTGAVVSSFHVNAGDIISVNAKVGTSGLAIYLVYDNGDTDTVAGISQSAQNDYMVAAKYDGTANVCTLKTSGTPVGTILVTSYSNSNAVKTLKRVVCCGDSYTAGYTVDAEGTAYRVNESFAWAHYMATATGNEWLNCGESGTNAKTWMESARGLSRAQTFGKAQAYMIGLAINDSSDTERHLDLGTPSDIGTNAETYYGCYSKIIRELYAISPDAYIFCMTCPREATEPERFHDYNVAVRTIVETYKSTYKVHLLDLYAYRSFFGAEIFKSDSWYSHYTAIGYEYMAEAIAKIMSLYMDINQEAFKYTALIPYDSAVTETGIDSILEAKASDAVTLTNVSTYVELVNGKYVLLDGYVFFRVIFKYLKNVSTGLNNIIANLPEPDIALINIPEYGDTSEELSTYLSYTTGWRLNGAHSAGQVGRFYGKYKAAT